MNDRSMTGRTSTVSGWATGGIGFAASIMIIIGVFQIVAGLTAIFDDGFYVVAKNYVFDLDPSAWGWIHLILGIVVLMAGFALFRGKTWASIVALVLAMISAIANFFLIPYDPVWSILIIALSVWVIWSLTRPEAVGD